jgi:hypothetical protein
MAGGDAKTRMTRNRSLKTPHEAGYHLVVEDSRGRHEKESAVKAGSVASPLPLLPITRLSFLFSIFLATVAGIQLYVLSTRTADFFAWTIGVPLTAAFLGAFFWANTPGFASPSALATGRECESSSWRCSLSWSSWR